MNPIVAQGLTVSHKGTTLAGPVSFTVMAGTTLGLWGPSGIGKSTLLRALVGLLPASLEVTGTLRVLGQDPRRLAPTRLADLRARAVLVSQEPVLFPGSILDNAMFGVRHVVSGSAAGVRALAHASIREAGLWDEVAARLDDDATTLSVGQRQRLCLARALALRPEILLVDEPTSALDARSRTEVEQTLRAVGEQHTVVLATHDRRQLESLAGAVLDLGRTAGGVPPRSETAQV